MNFAASSTLVCLRMHFRTDQPLVGLCYDFASHLSLYAGLGCYVVENGTVSHDANDTGWATVCREEKLVVLRNASMMCALLNSHVCLLL